MRMLLHRWLGVCAAFCIAATACASERDSAARILARELAAAGDHAAAAIEYHRCALDAESSSQRAGFYLAAAQERLLAGQAERALDLLDRAEDADAAVDVVAAVLRAGAEEARGNLREAAFYLAGAYPELAGADLRRAARLHLAGLHVADGDGARAAGKLHASDTAAADALEAYAKGRDKNPQLGGWLGVVPGLGYAYAGEYANAFRSFVLNGIFLYGMADTANDEEWGAFTVISALEFTWYSGSIYGGIDASHRYKRRRREAVVAGITGGRRLVLDRAAVPLAVLKIEF